ncbi:hypothetical protein OPV22_003130 [Ensete ventricosum]|uniref:Pentacotripeptide-repeat region of PRORP domain-containing protein n=1 Tax=Ensete ventricosum TaxID=4639 RepID=A0AAV8S001_ENSVE|nr:hypothetical protein OPV22_003130 [Ensete ventricosum]
MPTLRLLAPLRLRAFAATANPYATTIQSQTSTVRRDLSLEPASHSRYLGRRRPSSTVRCKGGCRERRPFESGHVSVEALANLFAEMKTFGPCPNVWTFNILFNVLCALGSLEDAFYVLEEMWSYRDGKLKEALGILETMGKEGCPPDLVTFNVLLHALCGHNAITEAHNFIQIMEEKRCLLDQFSWCALAGGLLRAGLVENSICLLQKIILMVNQAVDVVTWDIYFHSLCCNNNVKNVLDMAERMIEKGFTPTTFTYNIILKGLCKGQALEFLDSFARGGNGPDLISFNTILSTACKQEDSSMIRRVLTRMDIEGFNLDIVGMTCLMQYFSKAGWLSESFRLVKYMILHGHLPSTITCNVLLHGLCKKGFLAHAYRIFHEFKSMKTFPDTTSYNILIHASIRKADYSSTKCLLTDMYHEGLLPDATTYGSLCYGLCRKGSISAAVCLEPWMLESGRTYLVTFFSVSIKLIYDLRHRCLFN